jgi:tetraacyldisaccharide 4'-kinase
LLSTLYAVTARRRRERYARRPELRQRLHRPVISVGNLAVGGRGKTPMVATITRELLAMGERPAVLTRGYARLRDEKREFERE